MPVLGSLHRNPLRITNKNIVIYDNKFVAGHEHFQCTLIFGRMRTVPENESLNTKMNKFLKLYTLQFLRFTWELHA